jgi:hypothetical protein
MSDHVPHVPSDPHASPFRLVLDPSLRAKLHAALAELIDNHDQELAKHAADGFLELDSCKEYVELFARYLCETMGTREGVSYLLHACGFEVPAEQVELNRQMRWKVQR